MKVRRRLDVPRGLYPHDLKLTVTWLLAGATLLSGAACAASVARVRAAPVSALTEISRGCAGQNAEVEQAAGAGGYIYAAWMGDVAFQPFTPPGRCQGIGFAVSADHGRTWSKPKSLPGSAAAWPNMWDPAVTVAPTGAVYVSYITARNNMEHPVVAASFDHGRTFPQIVSILPPHHHNFGDRDFIAAGPGKTVYLTWDYAPSRSAVKLHCGNGGSCSIASGDFNIVLQRSKDGGKTWGPMLPLTPGFPHGSADSGPLTVESKGRVDVLYEGYQTRTHGTTHALTTGHAFFIGSNDRGKTWTPSVRVGPAKPTLSAHVEWWVGADIAVDAGGNLYAGWDTQSGRHDAAWLSYSTDHGKTWARPLRVAKDANGAPHIVEVAGGGPGTCYIAWLTNATPSGYGLYVRRFSVAGRRITRPLRVSSKYGQSSIWPGDTFGIASLGAGGKLNSSAGGISLTWGSAPKASPISEIFAARAHP